LHLVGSLSVVCSWQAYILELEQEAEPRLPTTPEARRLFHWGIPRQYRKQVREGKEKIKVEGGVS